MLSNCIRARQLGKGLFGSSSGSDSGARPRPGKGRSSSSSGGSGSSVGSAGDGRRYSSTQYGSAEGGKHSPAVPRIVDHRRLAQSQNKAKAKKKQGGGGSAASTTTTLCAQSGMPILRTRN